MPRYAHHLENDLKRVRIAAGLTQNQLATSVGISRQAYASLEYGRANPSTEVALRLARELRRTVDSLFFLPEQSQFAVDAELVVGSAVGPADGADDSVGQRTRVFRVGNRTFARPLSGAENFWHTVVPAEGLVLSETSSVHRVAVQPFDSAEFDSPTLSMLGCDPAVGLIEAALSKRGVNLVASDESSRSALLGLARGEAHVAGCHLLDDSTGSYNSSWVEQLVPFPCTLVTFATWQQGLIVAPGNPKNVSGLADLANSELRLVNRQAGSGSRALLDRRLAAAGMPSAMVNGYHREESGHLAVAATVASGSADVGIGVKAAAVATGLDFLPIEEERYDLVIPNHFLSDDPVQALLDLLRRPVLHRGVESLGGYDVSNMGVQSSAA